jgi:hypothetical protein
VSKTGKGVKKMKKTIIAFMALMFVAGLAGAGFAQDKAAKAQSAAAVQAQVIKGKIVSIDAANNQVTVKDVNGVEKAITVAASDIATLKKDLEVKITLKTGSSNVAASVKVIKHKVHSSK